MTKPSADKPIYLYRCYDRLGVLLYVGITDNPERRIKEHATDKFWWSDVAKTTNMAFKTREQALWAEWAVITTCHPLHNVTSPVPAAHKCPALAPPSPLSDMDGYISITKTLAEIKANADVYAGLHQEIDNVLAEAGVSGRSPWPND